MTPEKILAVIAEYEERFKRENIPRKRMDPDKKFSELSDFGKLAHAHWLIDGIRDYVRSPDTMDKANRHLASVQVLLSCADWYTLGELMDHNRPDTQEPAPERTDDVVYERTHEYPNPWKRY